MTWFWLSLPRLLVLWLWPILTVFVSSPAFAYDFHQWKTDAYDGTIKFVSDYDFDAVLTTTESAKQSADARTFFVNFGKFLAAETTAPKLLAPYTGVNPWAGDIQSVVAEQNTTMYRVWGGGPGGSQQVGAWLTPNLPTSAAQATADLALPPANAAQFYSEVVVPAGTRYQIGNAASAFGQAGGGAQVQLLQRIPIGNYGPGIPLPP